MTDDQIAAVAAVLDQAEQDRAGRFTRRCDRARFILARGVLRHLLAAYLGQPASTLSFRRGPYGKPALEQAGPSFNLSHSGNLVTIAVATAGHDVGIDVEQRRPLHDMAGLVRRCCSEAERVALSTLPVQCVEAAFFRLWTRKEAVLKATGEGLTRRLASISVGLAETAPLLSGAPGMALRTLEIIPGYAAALAVAQPDPQLRITAMRLS